MTPRYGIGAVWSASGGVGFAVIDRATGDVISTPSDTSAEAERLAAECNAAADRRRAV